MVDSIQHSGRHITYWHRGYICASNKYMVILRNNLGHCLNMGFGNFHLVAKSKRKLNYEINGTTKIALVESKYFSREDAQEIYEKVNNLLTELIKVSPLIHKDYEGFPYNFKRFADDERYKNILSQIAMVREKCADLKFDKWIGSYVALMAKFALYGDNPYEGDALRLFNHAHEQIRNYINTKLRSREKWKTTLGKAT